MRKSYRQNCESMRRVHISPVLDRRKVAGVSTEDVERLASRMFVRGASPKTVRNVMTFLHSVFGLAVRKGWAAGNPVEDAARPKRRRAGKERQRIDPGLATRGARDRRLPDRPPIDLAARGSWP